MARSGPTTPPKRALPDAVGTTLRVVRSRRRTPSASSKRDTLRLTVDLPPDFERNARIQARLAAFLATQPIEGVSIEDDRGTYMPFQVGAIVVDHGLQPHPAGAHPLRQG